MIDKLQEFPKAVSILIINNAKKILAVSRVKRDSNYNKIYDENGEVIPIDEWGLPGGKVDPDESIRAAAKRELREETGLVVKGLIPVFSRLSTQKKFMVTTFIPSETFGSPIRQKGEGEVDWKDMETIIKGPFGDYNRDLFKFLGLL